MSFVIWGFLNGFYQVLSEIINTIKHRLFDNVGKLLSINIPERSINFSKRVVMNLVTFALVSFTWIFFAVGIFHQAIHIIRCMFRVNLNVLFDGTLFSLGVDKKYTFVMAFGILILMAIDYFKYKKKDIIDLIFAQDWWFRASVYLGLIIGCMLFGCYGEMYDTQQFIYFQF